MRVALYIRVSTDEQVKEGFSISAQRERLTAYASSQDWDVIGYYVDEGESAKDLERTNLKRMIEHIEEGLIDVVLVYRLDRLTRSVLDLYKLLETFENNGCKFKSATEVYDTTTAMGRLFLTLVAALAQWERENLGERVSMGMTQRTREGKWKGGLPAFGYTYNKNNEEMTVNLEQARIVKMIFEWYIQGLGANKIAVRLNEMKIPTLKGGVWRDNQIRVILNNETYTGKLRHGVRVNKENAFNIDGAMPEIISQDTFDKVTQIRKGRASVHPREATSQHVFSGALRCNRCGSAMKGHKKVDKGKHYRSYRCINRKSGACSMPMVSERILEKTFIKHFENVEVIGEYKPPKADAKDLEQEIENIKKRRKKWQYAWANDLMDDNDFTDRMQEEDKAEKAIREELSESSVSSSANEVSIISKFIEENWKYLEVLEKKTFIQNMIERIVLDKVDVKKMADRVKIKDIQYK